MSRFKAAICGVALVLFSQAVHPPRAAGEQEPSTPNQPGALVDYAAARLDRRLPAALATGTITLDGALEEPSWAEAPMAHNFIQNDPREGQPATFDTEVRVLYDADAL